jgi:DNA-binding beta-propeller fold protein YncE
MATAHFSYAQLALGYHFSVDSGPSALAVDGSGNVFVADNESFGPILEITAASGYTTASPVGTGFWYPQGVVLDGNGNVFVADCYSDAVKEVLAAGGYQTVVTLAQAYTLANSFSYPTGIAVDQSGDVFVIDGGDT